MAFIGDARSGPHAAGVSTKSGARVKENGRTKMKRKMSFLILLSVTALLLTASVSAFAEDAEPASYGTFRQFTSSPDNARGLYQMFVFTFEHALSVDSIDRMRIFFGENEDDAGGQLIEVNREGRVRLGANGSQLVFSIGDGHLGDNDVIQTSKVIVDLQRSRMTQIGSTTLAIQLFLDFRDKNMEGRKRIYLSGQDTQTSSSSFYQRGGFTIAESESRHKPEWISMNPDDEEGRSQLFSFIVEDKDGAEDIDRIYLRYSYYKNTNYGSLLFTINPSTKNIEMKAGGLTLDGGVGENRLLRTFMGHLDLSESSIGIDRLGDRYVVKLKMKFGNSNVGRRKWWGTAIDLAGNSTNQKELGKYRVAYSKSAPHPMFMLPANSRVPARTDDRFATPEVYSFWWHDSDGIDDISTLRVKFATSPGEDDERVQVDYTRSHARLRKPNASSYYGAVSYGGGQILEGEYAILYGRSSKFTKIDDYTARVDLQIAFKGNFAGKYNVYLRGIDKSDNQKAWRRLNKLEVTTSSSKPSGRRILPFFSSSLTESYLFEFQDPDGANDIDWAEAEFRHAGDDGTDRDSFIIRYTQSDNNLRIFYANRLFQGEIGERKVIGFEGVHIDLRNCLVIHYKDRLQLYVDIEFDNAYIWGLKNILLWARDYADREARRRPFGGINIPADR